MSFLGNRVVRREDAKLLTTGGTYSGDISEPDALFAHFVTSTIAHARIASIETGDAKSLDGVVAVFVAEDLDLSERSPEIGNLPTMMRPWLASDVVRFVGEPVALIIANSPYVAYDAAERVFVDYEPLEPLVDLERALQGDLVVHHDAGTNVCFVMDDPDDPSLFEGADLVVSQRIMNQRLAPSSIEPRATYAAPTADGRLLVYSSTQVPHSVRDAVAAGLNLDPAMVHVKLPDVGGGFGAKATVYQEEVLVAWAAYKLGSPVRWTESRSQSMVGLAHGRGQLQNLELGATKEGMLVGYRISVLQHAGAYPALGAILPFATRMMATGTYRIPKVNFRATAVTTNTTPLVAYRGAGRPEATAAIERMFDILAAELDIDPVEIRRRNLVGKDEFPFTTTMGTSYDAGDYLGALDKVCEAADYRGLRELQKQRRASGDRYQIGIGVTSYVEITNVVPTPEFGGVEVRSDGSALVRSGTGPTGQGHATTWSMLVSSTLGIPMEKIEVVFGDTDVVPRGVGTFGSRSLQVGGVAVFEAAESVLDKAKKVASEILETAPEDVVPASDGSGMSVAGTPTATVTWARIHDKASEMGENLSVEIDFGAQMPTFPFGAHLAVVEVDTETGKVRLDKMVACDDAGTIINPLTADGQIHGGLAQGIAQALFEEFVYDADGNPLTSNFADYSVPSAAEMPSFQITHQVTPTDRNPLGVKGIGESGTIGSTPAVQNAVVDALSHLGVRHIDMPMTGERVWSAIMAAKGAVR